MNRLKLRQDNSYRLCMVRRRDGSVRLEEKIALQQPEARNDWPAPETEQKTSGVIFSRTFKHGPSQGKIILRLAEAEQNTADAKPSPKLSQTRQISAGAAGIRQTGRHETRAGQPCSTTRIRPVK